MSNAPEPLKYHRWTMADRLRAARESVTDSQAEFARLAKISRGTVSNYERGGETTPIYLERWADVSGFDLGWILTGIEPNVIPDGGGNVVGIGQKRAREQENEMSRCTGLSRLAA